MVSSNKTDLPDKVEDQDQVAIIFYKTKEEGEYQLCMDLAVMAYVKEDIFEMLKWTETNKSDLAKRMMWNLTSEESDEVGKQYAKICQALLTMLAKFPNILDGSLGQLILDSKHN